MFSTPRPRLLALASLLVVASACGGSSGGVPAGQNPVAPPAGTATPPFTAGLLAVAAGPSVLHVSWGLPPAGFEAALFVGPSAATLYQGVPVAVGLGGTGMTITGLPDGTVQFVGLGVRPAAGGAYQPSGIVLRARPGPPVYVDAQANAGGADGMTPATAFPDLETALTVAQLSGVGNVWVRDGNYSGAALSLGPGIHVYGGFDGAFSLTTRDPDGGNTVIDGVAGEIAVNVRDFGVGPGFGSAVLDGFRLAGGRVGVVGIDLDDLELELRCVTILDFLDRGIRLRNASDTDELDVQIAGVRVSSCGADGLSLAGAFDLRIHGSLFDANVQEGLDCDGLVALAGGRTTLVVEGSRFFGNGRQGLDVDLTPPPLVPGAQNGSFVVRIRGCRFERNGVEGLLLDHDFENAAGYTADVIVRESLARANRGAGFAIDADGVGSTLFHRCLATANGGNGFEVTSESQAGMVLLSASAATGNLDHGARSITGRKSLVATHAVFAGNLGGGFRCDAAEGAVASSVAYLQSLPFVRARMAGTVEVTDPFTVSTFVVAPEFYTRANSQDASSVFVSDESGIQPGSVAELADDGVQLAVVTAFNNEVTLNPAPQAQGYPAAFAVYPSGLGVDEDYRLPVGSPARDAGLAEPLAATVDAGVFGSPNAGDPGVADAIPARLFYPIEARPSLASGVARNQDLRVRFNRDVAPSSVLLGRVRTVAQDGTEIPSMLMSVADEVILLPPGNDWGTQPFVVELHLGLAAADGTILTTPLILPVRIRL